VGTTGIADAEAAVLDDLSCAKFLRGAGESAAWNVADAGPSWLLFEVQYWSVYECNVATNTTGIARASKNHDEWRLGQLLDTGMDFSFQKMKQDGA
jgi:hypothetical protein